MPEKLTPQKETKREPRKRETLEDRLVDVLMLLLNDPVICGLKARIRDAAKEEHRVNPIAEAYKVLGERR